MDKVQAEQLLKTALADTSVTFRDGQWEAIDALVNQNHKLLVVQRTGWGKSSVYFISTKIFRDRNMGPTIIVSPLLALMRNQIDSARRLGINAVTINSSNTEEWQEVTNDILNNKIDCLLISPEKLSNDNFVEKVLQPISDTISLMVIDEAHCISDWGHDFRPDYRRIVNIIGNLPTNTPVLGTTATANNRVVEDIKEQLGDINIQRGPLTRESLSLQTNILPDQASRLAWLAKTIPNIAGTGIIYALTKRDAEQVTSWLQSHKINALAYYSGVTHSDFANTNVYRQHLEEMLLRNDLKVLVSTSALGMGYDKPDLGFVIHYQAPGSIVSYYQQVGRAGRGVDNAIGVLLSGKEDQDIHAFFRRTAFPSQQEVERLLNALNNSDGLSVQKLEKEANLSNQRIENTLKFLASENPTPVYCVGKTWFRVPVKYQMDMARIQRITEIRQREWSEMEDYMTTTGCLMEYIRITLDDKTTSSCGKCINCLGKPIINAYLDDESTFSAVTFLKRTEEPIEPRKEIAKSNDEAEKTFVINQFPRHLGELSAQKGRVLSRWGDAGWGQMVADDKHSNHFRDELVDAITDMIRQRWQLDEPPTWICCVPSLNHTQLVPEFAKRLAQKLGLPFIDAIEKIKQNAPQKAQENRFHQCHNLDGVFSIKEPIPQGNVFLIDDVVDSRWTLTVLSALLQQAGSGKVYPVALASTSVSD